MFKLFAISAVSVLIGCSTVTESGWNLNTTIVDPLEQRCAQVFLGSKDCNYDVRRSEVSRSDSVVQKTIGLEDPLELIPYLGINISTVF